MKSREILGESPAVKELTKLIQRVASSKTNILVIGESGTGKELVARMIHDIGPLKAKPFVAVNCGAIPENLIESELFGHKKGSFTGAVSDKPGLFEVADGGTLFLDEVGELPLGLQVKLLRAIQERVFRRVGGNEDIRVDVRIIAATNRDLEAAVAKGTFREDLYYRLNVILIPTPPLRERKGDVRLLAETFLKRFAEKAGKKVSGFSPEAMEALERYPWPGNIRELENSMERVVTLASDGMVQISALPVTISQGVAAPVQTTTENGVREIRLPAPDFSAGKVDLEAVVGQLEKIYILEAIKYAGGSKKAAADLLGVTFRSLRYRLTKLGLGD